MSQSNETMDLVQQIEHFNLVSPMSELIIILLHKNPASRNAFSTDSSLFILSLVFVISLYNFKFLYAVLSAISWTLVAHDHKPVCDVLL